MPSTKISQKRLKAIVFTDIAGFTKLSAQDEQKALDLIQKQNALIKPIVERYNGKWLKEIGDGLLLSFDSSLDAVQCCTQIQDSLRNEDDINLRIGIHQGDIFIKDGDVYGDDVNVASRIEPFSAVGGIAISDKVQRDISSTPEISTKYIGKPQLKGVSQKVELYCITSHNLPETKLSEVSAKLEKKINWFRYVISAAVFSAILTYYFFPKEKEVPSVGILMMENLGIDDDNFWSRGITEDLIVKVASAGLIRVAPMKEILQIDMQNSFKEIAKKLRVKYLLTSSMHKKEERFELRCQLIEVESGLSTYANKWNQSINNAALIVDMLGNNILKSLDIEIASSQNDLIQINAEAYEFYLRGKYKYEMSEDVNDTKISRGLLKKAISLDSNLISARNVLGWTYYRTSRYDSAKVIYEDALNLADKLGDTYQISRLLNNIGLIYAKKHDYSKALNNYNRSLQIKIKLDDRRGIGIILNNMGNIYRDKADYTKSMQCYNRSLKIQERLDNKQKMRTPLNNIGINLLIKGNYKDALKYFNRSLQIYENLGYKWDINWVLNKIGYAYLQIGDYENAVDYFEKSISTANDIGLGSSSLLEPTIYLFLSNKYMDKQNNLENLYKLLKETTNIGYEVNFHLFELLSDIIYIEQAFNQVQEIALSLELDKRKIFFHNPIPKAIVEEWEKLNDSTSL